MSVLFFALLNLGHAGPNEVARFDRNLRAYFAAFTSGIDVVDRIRFTGDVEPDATYVALVARLPRSALDPDDRILREVAFVSVFGRVVCRVGFGWTTVSAQDPTRVRAVVAQCVPLTEVARREPDLVDAYSIARDQALANQALVLHPPRVPVTLLRGMHQERLATLVESRDLFFDDPRVIRLNTYVGIVDRTKVTLEFPDGTSRVDVEIQPRWTFSFDREGRAFATCTGAL